MSHTNQPTILIIVGITGDLSSRYLLPAIEKIAAAGVAPNNFKIIGVTRRTVNKEEVIASLKNKGAHSFLEANLQMCQMDLAHLGDYQILADHITAIEQEFNEPTQKLFYLSVPPQVSQPVVELLGQSGLAKASHTKLLLEKPFGTDLASAKELVEHTDNYFKEDQVYRIDHYLAKEMAQNLLVFRGGNSLFKRTWSKDFIEKIEVISSEQIDIEGRGAFYEQTGALRDLVQSHLLQLVALTLMDIPEADELEKVPSRRLDALKQLHATEHVKRAQYKGYRDEVANQHSYVETFVDITLRSSDPIWEGVPIKITTGKALDKKATEIHVTYKKEKQYESNKLVIRLQPNEGISLVLWTKVPGYEQKLEHHSLDIAFRDIFTELPDAYERVFLDAINSNHTLFAGSGEVLEAWRILQPIQSSWSMQNDDLIFYDKGVSATSV